MRPNHSQAPGEFQRGQQQTLAETAPTGVLIDADADLGGEVATFDEERAVGQADDPGVPLGAEHDVVGKADAADVVADLCVTSQRQETVRTIICVQAQQMIEDCAA